MHFAAGNPKWQELNVKMNFGHVVKFAGRLADPLPLTISRILYADESVQGKQRRFQSRGQIMLTKQEERE